MMITIQFVCWVLMQSKQRGLLPEMSLAVTLGVGTVPLTQPGPLAVIFQPAPFSNVRLLAFGSLRLFVLDVNDLVVKIPQ